MARNTAVDYGKGVAVFSLEMSSVQLVKRLIASESRISAEKLRKGDLKEHEFQQLHSRIGKLAEAPIFIDDTPGINIFDFRAKCRRLKAQHNIELIIIDYLQLMSAKDSKSGGNREQEISTISRSIKEIAKELNVPIIALSQLSRSVETRGGDKRPMLSDLRESGAIEQDADIVSFIYRPEYYDLTQDADGNSTLGIGEIIIAKHRNGALKNVRLRFVPEFARFENIDEVEALDLSGTTNSGLNQFNQEFNTYTIKSKMDDSNEDIFSKDNNDEDPF
jgi:replicative DNA helicase